MMMAYQSFTKKKSRKCKSFIAILREETMGFTDFMMGSVSLVTKKKSNSVSPVLMMQLVRIHVPKLFTKMMHGIWMFVL